MNRALAVWNRAWKTLVQSAIGAAATAAISTIGTATTMGQVDWKLVASTACLATVVSLLMNIKASLPELEAGDIALRDEDDRSDDAYEDEEV